VPAKPPEPGCGEAAPLAKETRPLETNHQNPGSLIASPLAAQELSDNSFGQFTDELFEFVVGCGTHYPPAPILGGAP
jgi:hypothetical protein